jgi:hypothetical protein
LFKQSSFGRKLMLAHCSTKSAPISSNTKTLLQLTNESETKETDSELPLNQSPVLPLNELLTVLFQLAGEKTLRCVDENELNLVESVLQVFVAKNENKEEPETLPS